VTDNARNFTITLFILLFCASLALFGCNENRVSYPARTMPVELSSNPDHIKSGEALFYKKCASCHGKPSEGRSDRAIFFNPPAPDFTDIHYKELDPAYLYYRIELGKTVEPYKSQGSVMPAWGLHFSDQQIWQIVAYLRFRAH
jgi:mono/diheme cytochrome c family protein